MKYLIAYKQDENTYSYVTNIGSRIDTTLFYGNAIDFLNKTNAENICDFLNEYDSSREYVVLVYEYSITEVTDKKRSK